MSLMLPLVCTGVLLLTAVFSSAATATGGDDCKSVNLTGIEGKFNLTGESTNCYEFKVFGQAGPIYFYLKENVFKKNISSILVQNINKTQVYAVSNRTFAGDNEKYIVLGYGVSNTTEVARVTVNLTTALATNHSIVAGHYSANSSDGCKQSYTGVPTQITLPEYQPGVGGAYSCVYHYDLEPQADIYTDSLAFTDFSLTSANSSLSVSNDASSGKPVVYRGDALPPDFIVDGNFTVTWNMSSKSNDSFTAAHTQSTAGCTVVIKVGADGTTVNSTGYPNTNYGDNLDCKTVITSDDAMKRLRLTVNDVKLAADSDRVQVIDGGASRDAYNKSIQYLTAFHTFQKDAVLVSSGPSVMIRFTTDDLGTAKGFSYTVKQTNTSQLYYTPANISYLTTTNQTEPVYLSLKAPSGSLVSLQPNVTLNGSATVSCYDGDSTAASLVAQYRAKQYTYNAYSSRNRMLCVASGFKTTDRFNATTLTTYQAVGLTKLSTSAAGTYNLDVSALRDATYEWIVQPESYDTVIELVISDMKVPGGSANVTILVLSLQNDPVAYSSLNGSTPLPYSIRVPLYSSLRVSVVVKYGKNVMTGAPLDVSELSLAASYTTDNTTANVTGSNGTLSSPLYPKGTPARTYKTWNMSVPSAKSYQLSFSSAFQLSNGSTLKIYGKSRTYLNITGPTSIAPNDVILNNTKANETLALAVELSTRGQSEVTGVQIVYTVLDAGYSSAIANTPQRISTPKYPRTLNYTYKGSWVLSVPHKNSNGLLQRVLALVTFNASTPAMLQLRDGSRADSPLLTLNRTDGKQSGSVLTNSSYLYVSYSYTADPKHNGSFFQLIASADTCSNSSQCVGRANASVCMPSSWRCDGVYQCIDGKDELGCAAPPTTKPPAVTSEGAQWWVVALCILAGVVLGVVCSVIGIVCVMRRRSRGYNRLSELMTPIPT